ncbi:uracil-5--methyltransferase-domain-containing protein, partial [Dunaliella salina]
MQVNFHTTQVGEAMVTLVYHKKLDDLWQESARKLRTLLAQAPSTHGHMPHVIGRSRKQKVELDSSCVVEQLTVNDKVYLSKQVEATFSQPNACMCEHMVSWAQTVTAGSHSPAEAAIAAAAAPPASQTAAQHHAEGVDGPGPAGSTASEAGQTSQADVQGTAPTDAKAAPPPAASAAAQPGQSDPQSSAQAGTSAAAAPAPAPAATQANSSSGVASTSSSSSKGNHDLLELYCGNGNFTIPLACNFRRVVATEVSKSGVEAARWNIQANKVDNIFVARMSSEEFTEAWKSRANRKRLEGLDWSQLELRTVLVDPPRAGLDPGTVKLVSEFDRIVYISCNPETLLKNLKDLMPTHKLARFAAFDQFPYTHHLECGAYLVKREQQQ